MKKKISHSFQMNFDMESFRIKHESVVVLE